MSPELQRLQVSEFRTMSPELTGTHLVSIDEIERQTGLDFLWMLDDTAEEELEGVPAPQMW